MVVAASCCVSVFQRQGNERRVRIEEKINGTKYRKIIDENLLQRAQDLKLGLRFTFNRTTAISTQPRQHRSSFGTNL